MKNIIKDLIFIIIFLCLLIVCSNIFVLKGNTYGSDVISFYNEKKNSLDLIFFGSSHSYTTFSPDIIEKETGLKSYNFATQQQPIYITYHYMIEALKTQKPKYFVLETRMLASTEEYASEGVIRDAIDKMKMSKNKIEVIDASIPKEDNKLSYYFNIIKYHSRYNELTKTDIINGITYKGINNRGFKDLPSNESIAIDNTEILKLQESKEITPKNLEYLTKILELAKDNNIKLILVKSPCLLNENDQLYYNWVEEYANSHNIDYINYNKIINELKLIQGDYYDSGHLSITGAEKVSIHFTKFLNSKYSLK